MKFKVVHVPFCDTGAFPGPHWEICTTEFHPANVICFDGDANTIKKMVTLWNKHENNK